MSDRRFIVQRNDAVAVRTPVVTIREVTAGSCAYDQSREEAWAYAHRLAKPAKLARLRTRRLPASIYFTDLTGESRKVADPPVSEQCPSKNKAQTQLSVGQPAKSEFPWE